MNYQLTFPQSLTGTIVLPASKSISARALIMGALAGNCSLSNLSDCDDTRVLRKALGERLPEIDIMAAGTAMRFSTAYFATCTGESHVITGTARMQQRPIQVLVDALRQLGADIEYVGNEGFPPLRITGKTLKGGEVELPANVSSQYISALLMIGPTLEKGLHLHLIGEVVSRPYIDMTLGLMKEFGAQASWSSEQDIFVAPHPYTAGMDFCVEPDWSGASYWYEAMALSPDAKARITLPALRENSWQGDSAVCRLFRQLGVDTHFEKSVAILTKNNSTEKPALFDVDFTACPDLAQTFVVTCALMGQPFRFAGLQSLRIKETDRIAALQHELKKLGIDIQSVSQNENGKRIEILEMLTPQAVDKDIRQKTVEIATYEDHRMAMAFAPAAMIYPQLQIAHPEVVSKSYPTYWEDLLSIGATIQDTEQP